MDDIEQTPESNKNEPAPEPELNDKYKVRGFQKVSLAEYQARRIKHAKRLKVRIPPAIKFIGISIFSIIFCFGIVYIPWILYTIATHPIGWSSNKKDSGAETKKSNTSTQEETK